MNEIKQYGFKLNTVEDPRAYKLGAIELPKTILVGGGQWTMWLPIDELQHTPSYDTYGCTVYGTENIQQTLERFHYGFSKEYDERYNYNLVKVTPPGADPHDVAESFRNDGVISGVFPITETYEEYAKPRPMPTKYVSQGIAHPYELRHQWVWTRPISKAERTKLIKEYLQYSPLCVSVTAWKQKDGLYVDDGQRNTHWTMLYGYTDKGWLIYDSYSPHRKVLSFDHNIECCKRYALVPSTRKQQLSIIGKILALIERMLNAIDIPTTKPLPTYPYPLPQQPQIIQSPVIESAPPKFNWDTPILARQSVREICDEEGLSVVEKNELCATVGAESGWKPNAKNENRDKYGKLLSTDWGIAQINDFYHIGAGKAFPSVEYVLNNPEAVIRWMCRWWKSGAKHWWIAYKNGSYKKYL